MSMDEQFAEMKRFQDALIAFNEQLKTSMTDLESQHANVSPYWQDEMRRAYDSVWEPFHQTMKHYIASESRGYVEFLAVKLHTLARYLGG